MFHAKSDISNISNSMLIEIDNKDYTTEGAKYQVSLLETKTPKAVFIRREGLKNALFSISDVSGVPLIFLFVIDIAKHDAI